MTLCNGSLCSSYLRRTLHVIPLIVVYYYLAECMRICQDSFSVEMCLEMTTVQSVYNSPVTVCPLPHRFLILTSPTTTAFCIKFATKRNSGYWPLTDLGPWVYLIPGIATHLLIKPNNSDTIGAFSQWCDGFRIRLVGCSDKRFTWWNYGSLVYF